MRIKDHVLLLASVLLHQFQLIRLRIDRLLFGAIKPGRHRVMATACYHFPIYSQTFIYQELTQLIRSGTDLRFLYSRLNSRDQLPAQFESLWRSRRRLVLNAFVGRRSFLYFKKRFPEKVVKLIELLSAASGIPDEDLQRLDHFLQAFCFARMVEAYRPVYLHSYFFYEGTLFALVASFLLDIPRGVSCYTDHLLEDYALKLVPLHLEQCGIVVATSERIREELRQIAPGADSRRIIVKPNAINAAEFPPLRLSEPQPGEPYHLVCVSRIEPKKGLIYLVEALKILRDRNHHAQLHFIGGADENGAGRCYFRALQKRVEELMIGSFTYFHGRKTESEIKDQFKKAHLFVAPFIETEYGDKDGIPTSLLEAMASGLPVITTDAGSIGEVIEHEQNGLLVRQRDASALAWAIGYLLENPGRRERLGRNAAQTVRSKFDVTVCEHLFHDNLAQILSGRSQA